MMSVRKAKNGFLFKIGFLLVICVFALMLLGSSVAEGSGVTTQGSGVRGQGSVAELEVGSYIGQDEGTAPAYVAGNTEFFSVSANFVSEAALSNITLVFFITLLSIILIATFVYSKFNHQARSRPVLYLLRY